ncbi:hypothetical protein P8C59_009102 [Phyllachora maydis]|uniref:Uncharacterized protein n=1 Tax=Phyllachora maydis TaxID=1825666 RepID=A0AAD9IDW8_9PEZI|nr:hypothetical protein P8C59_009102 [Phyllachora maydis]
MSGKSESIPSLEDKSNSYGGFQVVLSSNPLEGTTYTFYASLSWSSELQMNRWTEFESGKDVCARIMGSDPVHFVVVSVYRTHQLLPRWQNYLNARARYYDVMRWMLYHVMDPSARYFNGPAFPTPAGGPKAIASVLKKASQAFLKVHRRFKPIEDKAEDESEADHHGSGNRCTAASPWAYAHALADELKRRFDAVEADRGEGTSVTRRGAVSSIEAANCGAPFEVDLIRTIEGLVPGGMRAGMTYLFSAVLPYHLEMGLNSWTAQDKKKIDKVLEGAKARFWNMYVEREQLNQYPDVLLRTALTSASQEYRRANPEFQPVVADFDVDDDERPDDGNRVPTTGPTPERYVNYLLHYAWMHFLDAHQRPGSSNQPRALPGSASGAEAEASISPRGDDTKA